MRLGTLIFVIVLACSVGNLSAKESIHTDLITSVSKVLPNKTYGTVMNACRADLDLNGTQEIVAITYKTRKDGHPLGGQVVVMQQSENGLKVIESHKSLNPWKLQIADVDGDKKKEITLGVWKKSPKDQVMAKRVFVYYWSGKRMLPKWLGSRLSRRFEDFKFKDINKDGWDELLALEVSPGKPKRIGIYRWKSFGFEWLGSAEPRKWKELTK